MSIEQNECIFALMSLRLVLIVYFLVMNSKRCNFKNILLDCWPFQTFHRGQTQIEVVVPFANWDVILKMG